MLYSKRAHASSLVFVSLIATLLVFCSGCGLDSFTFEEESQEVVIDGSALNQLPVNPFGGLDLNIDLDQELEARDAGPADGVFLQDLKLSITDTKMPEGDTDTFNFLDSLTIYANADGLDKKQVAILSEVPQDQQQITLNTDSGINLKPYIEAGMTLQAEADGSVPDDDTSLKALVTILVDLL
jgi:hypothetical protein